MSDVLAWIALHALDGWLLAGVLLLLLAAAFAAGSRWQMWRDDRRRAQVRSAWEDAAAGRVGERLPRQKRRGRD